LKKSEPVVDYLAEELKREQQKREAKPGVKAMGRQQVQAASILPSASPTPKDRNCNGDYSSVPK
jgi:hypothetical protein